MKWGVGWGEGREKKHVSVYVCVCRPGVVAHSQFLWDMIFFLFFSLAVPHPQRLKRHCSNTARPNILINTSHIQGPFHFEARGPKKKMLEHR